MADRGGGPEGLKKLATGLDVNGGAAFMAGLVGGLVFLIIELITGYAMGFAPPLGPADVVLSALVQGDVQAFGFDFGLIFIAAVFQIFVAVLLAFILAFLVYRWSTQTAVLVGVVYGFVVYLVGLLLFGIGLSVIGSARGLIMLLNHLLLGGLMAWIYKTIETGPRPAEPAGTRTSRTSA